MIRERRQKEETKERALSDRSALGPAPEGEQGAALALTGTGVLAVAFTLSLP